MAKYSAPNAFMRQSMLCYNSLSCGHAGGASPILRCVKYQSRQVTIRPIAELCTTTRSSLPCLNPSVTLWICKTLHTLQMSCCSHAVHSCCGVVLTTIRCTLSVGICCTCTTPALEQVPRTANKLACGTDLGTWAEGQWCIGLSVSWTIRYAAVPL